MNRTTFDNSRAGYYIGNRSRAAPGPAARPMTIGRAAEVSCGLWFIAGRSPWATKLQWWAGTAPVPRVPMNIGRPVNGYLYTRTGLGSSDTCQ